MMKTYLSIFFSFAVIFYACDSQTTETQQTYSEQPELRDDKAEETVKAGFEETAKDLIAKVQQSLLSEVQKAIEEGGVEHAINYCSAEAVSLTQQYKDEYGLSVARVSHKYRNHENFASEEELAIMMDYILKLESGAKLEPIVRETGSGSKVFYSPILLASPMCLQCHGEPGEDIKTEDFITIRMIYPDDRATGFKLGDFRGMWKVTQKEML